MSETHFSSVKRKILRDVRQNPLTFPPSSYYIVVVFIDPLQGLYAILFGDTVDWFHFPTT